MFQSVTRPGDSREGPECLTVVVSVSQRVDHTVVTVSGEVDPLVADVLRSVGAQLLARSESHVVVDLERVSFCDAAGLRALLTLRDVVSSDGGEVLLRRPGRPLQRLLELTSTTQAFHIE